VNKKKRSLSSKEKWMQRFFALAGNIAPVTTIRILVRLLFTPKKRPLKPAHVECMNNAEKFTFEVEEFGNPGKTLKLSCYSWGKGDKAVLLVHGWDARAMDYYKMIPALVEAGYWVFAFDGPAHGFSEGERSHLIDFKQVIYRLSVQQGTPYAIIGHSMGGAAAAYMLMDHDLEIEKLITIAIPTISKRFFEEMFAIMKVPVRMQRAFFKGYIEELGEPIENYNLIERKERIKAKDFLMIYDEHDEIVPPKDVKDFLQRHPEIKTVNAKDAGHYGIIKNKQVIKEVIDFLNK
jgi:pimeloyl-ACP methyl ester carboxylesterase